MTSSTIENSQDPGDRTLLQMADQQKRVLVTIDTDFGALVFKGGETHSGIVRLPDVPPAKRIRLMEQVLAKYADQLNRRAVVTVRGGRIRISVAPP